MKFILLCILLLPAALWADSKQDVLHFGVSISTSAQREAFYTMARKFEALNPDIAVEFKALTSEEYKEQFAQFLAGHNQYDVLYWHAGERLLEYVDQGLVAAINDVWINDNLDQAFDQSIINTLQRNGNHYAVPISYYQMGFYYSKNLFENLNIQEPQTWDDLIAVCEFLSNKGIPPIFIDTASDWPATAWFDYLNLRINGLSFHKQVTAGEINFNDERIKRVLTTWDEAITKGCFTTEHTNMDWREGLPLIFRGFTGMSLLGNYITQDIPGSIVSDVGFFGFPKVNPKMKVYEEAPLDVLLIPQSSKNKVQAKRFLQFVSQADTQLQLNRMLGVISPHRMAQSQNSELLQEAYQILSKADGISQFFDRDAKKSFAEAVMPIIAKFATNGDVDSALIQLEQARQQVLLK